MEEERNQPEQEELDERVEAAVQAARADWEQEQTAMLDEQREQLRQAAMNEAEQAYAQRMAELDRRQRQTEVAQMLTQSGLPADFAPWLTGDTAEESQQRVTAFQAAFQAGVDSAVTARMAGAAPVEPSRPAVYDRDNLRGMSPREINAHWAEIQNTLKGSV